MGIGEILIELTPNQQAHYYNTQTKSITKPGKIILKLHEAVRK